MSADTAGRGTTQVRFEDCPPWMCGKSAVGNISLVPFIGKVAGETPAVTRCDPEVRRRDVGAQRYGSGIPTFAPPQTILKGWLPDPKAKKASTDIVETPHGPIRLTQPPLRKDYMPGADVIDFLRSEYVGTRHSDPPQRYFK